MLNLYWLVYSGWGRVSMYVLLVLGLIAVSILS